MYKSNIFIKMVINTIPRLLPMTADLCYPHQTRNCSIISRVNHPLRILSLSGICCAIAVYLFNCSKLNNRVLWLNYSFSFSKWNLLSPCIFPVPTIYLENVRQMSELYGTLEVVRKNNLAHRKTREFFHLRPCLNWAFHHSYNICSKDRETL